MLPSIRYVISCVQIGLLFSYNALKASKSRFAAKSMATSRLCCAGNEDLINSPGFRLNCLIRVGLNPVGYSIYGAWPIPVNSINLVHGIIFAACMANLMV